jgi:hypothetical protein
MLKYSFSQTEGGWAETRVWLPSLHTWFAVCGSSEPPVIRPLLQMLAPMPAESWMEAAYHWGHADGPLPDRFRDALYAAIGRTPDPEFIRLVYPLVLAHNTLHPDRPLTLPASRHGACTRGDGSETRG